MATFWLFGCAIFIVALAVQFWRAPPTPERISTLNRALPLLVGIAGLSVGGVLRLSGSAWAEPVFQLSFLTSSMLNIRRGYLDGTFRGPFTSRATLGLSDTATPSGSRSDTDG